MKNRISGEDKTNMPKNSRHRTWILMYAVMAVFFVGISIMPASAKAEKNASDAAAVKKIIKEQRAQAERGKASTEEVNVMMKSLDKLENLGSRKYVWSSKGRLIGLNWSGVLLTGDRKSVV